MWLWSTHGFELLHVTVTIASDSAAEDQLSEAPDQLLHEVIGLGLAASVLLFIIVVIVIIAAVKKIQQLMKNKNEGT